MSRGDIHYSVFFLSYCNNYRFFSRLTKNKKGFFCFVAWQNGADTLNRAEKTAPVSCCLILK